MDKITPQDVYTLIKKEHSNVIKDLMKVQAIEKHTGMVVLTKEDLKKAFQEVAWAAWKGAANAYRLFPENKHTFSNYWENSGRFNLPIT